MQQTHACRHVTERAVPCECEGVGSEIPFTPLGARSARRPSSSRMGQQEELANSSVSPPLVTRPLTITHLAAAASLTSQAFLNSPPFKAMVPDLSRRATFLPWLFERNFWLRLGLQSAYCVFQGDELVMFYMFEKPGLPRLTCVEMLRAGLALGYVVHGVAAMRRLLETKAWFEAWERKVLGERAGAVARFERVTVLPARQGQGVGTAALRVALQEADDLGLAVYLCTQEERNVRFYRRLGFEVVADEHCPLGDEGGFRNWLLLREVASSREHPAKA
jgi:GNAT superfamily N-acetyltransferase